jgi:hypothetical protein
MKLSKFNTCCPPFLNVKFRLTKFPDPVSAVAPAHATRIFPFAVSAFTVRAVPTRGVALVAPVI